MEKPLRVLMAEDSEDDALLIMHELRREGYDPVFERVDTSEAMKAALTRGAWDIVLSDHSMPQFNSLLALQVLRDSGMDLPFIIVSGKIGEEAAVAAMKAGASDYIMKDNLARLAPAIDRALRGAEVRREHKRAVEALQKSEQRFKELADLLPQTVFELDEKGNLTFANHKAFETFGYTKDDFAKVLNVLQMVGPGDRERVRVNTRRILSGEKVIDNEYVLQRKDGSAFFGIISSSPIEGKKGRTGLRGIITDITDRKKAEEALRESEEALRVFLNANVDAAILIDAQGTVLVANESLLKRLDRPIDEIIGSCLYHLLPEEDIVRQRKTHIEEVIRTGKPVRFEDMRRGRNYETFAYPVFDREGHVTKIAILGFDITERKRLEQEMLNLQEQFRQAQKMEAIGQLAGGIAHDFNNLLTVIQGYSQLSLMDLGEDSSLRENIEEIKQAAEKAANLTRQLLAFSRRQVLEMKVLDLNSIVKDLEKMLRRVIGEDIELFMLLSEDSGRVRVDRGQIEQVLLNLAVNARDAMPSGGKLIIETAKVELDEAYSRNHVSVKPGPHLMLSITDTGIGMSPEVMKQIFEPFFTTKERGKGTGLGLSTVYGIVKQSEGNIWVYSEPGKGTTFKVYLPQIDGALEEVSPKKVKKELPGGGETILVVEDEEIVRKLTVKLLRQHGYRVLEIRQWEEALTLCEESRDPIHLILTDVVMPEVSGPQLMEQLRQVRQDFKVIYMSGYADHAIVKLGILDQGISFLQKPFSQDSLLHKIRDVLDH
jgi:two-component system, cell cycle sensor histidine kinase and response regulator CckA